MAQKLRVVAPRAWASLFKGAIRWVAQDVCWAVSHGSPLERRRRRRGVMHRDKSSRSVGMGGDQEWVRRRADMLSKAVVRGPAHPWNKCRVTR